MISYETQQAILTLKEKGHSLREISRILKVSRNTVRRALREKAAKPAREKPEQQAVIDLLAPLYRRCKGNAVRIQEVLQEEYGIEIAYSSLTRLIRQQELRAPKKRSGFYTFGPGTEMQHDTSPHRLKLGNKTVTAQCASLILAYSRYWFFQYYPVFTRFEAQAFLHEAFRFMDGTCPRCVIDNTSVLLAGGSGANAVIAPKMEAFVEPFGVEFFAHAIDHADRKARVEKAFAYAEGNFLAARDFRDWTDLNAQARAWCQERANTKPKRDLGMSPQAAYVIEKPYLQPLPPYIPPVNQILYRGVDTQGFVHLDTNKYSVPDRYLGKPVAVHKRPERVLLFYKQTLIADHPRLIGQRNARHRIEGHHRDLHRGRTRKGPSPQEQALSGQDPLLDHYVAALKQRSPGRGASKLRRLLALQRTYPAGPFLAAVEQALQYGLFDLARLERLILERVADDFFHLDEDF